MIDNNNQISSRYFIDFGDADKITLGATGLSMEGYSLPWPDHIDFN